MLPKNGEDQLVSCAIGQPDRVCNDVWWERHPGYDGRPIFPFGHIIPHTRQKERFIGHANIRQVQTSREVRVSVYVRLHSTSVSQPLLGCVAGLFVDGLLQGQSS